MPETKTGTVKWFNDSKGFGFILYDHDEKEAFVHHKDIDMGGFRFLRHGQQVSFEVENGPKGLLVPTFREHKARIFRSPRCYLAGGFYF